MEVGGCAALLVQARPRRQESVLVRVQHCGRVPGVPVRDLLLGAKHGGPPRLAADADETDSETAGQTLVKKQRSAATPKLKVPGSTKLAAASKSMIYVTILMNFLIHELNKFTSIESPSQSLNGHCNCILDEADNRGNGKWTTSRGG